MKERLRKYAPLVGYPLFYLLCLGVFAAVTFPYDKLKQRIVATYNAQQRASGAQQELQIDQMSGSWVTGVRVLGARIVSAPTEPGKPPGKMEIDDATVRYSLLSALIGNTSIDFDVDAFGGDVFGSYQVHGKDKSFEVTLESVDLGAVQPLVALLGVPLKGQLGGTIALTIPEGKTTKATGSVALEASGVAVGDGKAKIKGALALPTIDVGGLALAGEAKDGALRISKLLAGGKDLELQGDGRITIRESVGDSLCDAQVRFQDQRRLSGQERRHQDSLRRPGVHGASALRDGRPQSEAGQALRRLLQLDAARPARAARLHPGRGRVGPVACCGSTCARAASGEPLTRRPPRLVGVIHLPALAGEPARRRLGDGGRASRGDRRAGPRGRRLRPS